MSITLEIRICDPEIWTPASCHLQISVFPNPHQVSLNIVSLYEMRWDKEEDSIFLLVRLPFTDLLPLFFLQLIPKKIYDLKSQIQAEYKKVLIFISEPSLQKFAKFK